LLLFLFLALTEFLPPKPYQLEVKGNITTLLISYEFGLEWC